MRWVENPFRPIFSSGTFRTNTLSFHKTQRAGAETHFSNPYPLGWGKIGLHPRGVTDVQFPNPPPPLLARRDGAMTTGIQSPPVPPVPPTVVVFMSRLFRCIP